MEEGELTLGTGYSFYRIVLEQLYSRLASLILSVFPPKRHLVHIRHFPHAFNLLKRKKNFPLNFQAFFSPDTNDRD